MSLKNLLSKSTPIIGLSPMDGVTDYPFRQVQCQITKPDILFTEFVSAEGISHGGLKLFDQLLYTDNQRPIIAQLFGKHPDSFYQATIILCFLGFDGIDLNMGCPAKIVTSHGSGAALIDQPQLASQLIKAVYDGVGDYQTGKVNLKNLKTPQKIQKVITRNQKFSSFNPTTKTNPTISVKTRIGTNRIITKDWIGHLLKHQLDFITLHGRTLKQGFSGQSNWKEINIAATLASSTPTRLFGNGDLKTYHQAQDFCKKYQTSGALIGRAAAGNPWCFSGHSPSPKEKFSAMLLHAQIYQKTFPHRRFDPLRKHFLNYSKSLPNAKKLRQLLVRVSSLPQLLKTESQFIIDQ